MTFTPKWQINLDGKNYLIPSDVLRQIKELAKPYQALTMDAKNSEYPDGYQVDDAAIARNDVLNRIASNNK
jgi:hypothetical protein